jgi:hypothetical protein
MPIRAHKQPTPDSGPNCSSLKPRPSLGDKKKSATFFLHKTSDTQQATLCPLRGKACNQQQLERLQKIATRQTDLKRPSQTHINHQLLKQFTTVKKH